MSGIIAVSIAGSFIACGWQGWAGADYTPRPVFLLYTHGKKWQQRLIKPKTMQHNAMNNRHYSRHKGWHGALVGQCGTKWGTYPQARGGFPVGHSDARVKAKGCRFGYDLGAGECPRLAA